MQHVYSLAEVRSSGPSIVAVGVFDGVHRGHQHLLRRLVHTAHANDCVPAVLTFHPHPDVVLGFAQGRYYLSTLEERAALLHSLGVEIVVTHPFDEDVRQVRAADFVDRLLAHLNLAGLWVGRDFALGYRREGTVDFLRQQGEQKGFTLEVVDLVSNDGNNQTLNSKNIRTALEAGDIETANRWLGRPYRLAGEVVYGDGRGRQIGFPTANIDVWSEKLLPARGVYAGWAYLGDERFMAVTNVGHRPTFDGRVVRVEAHLLDFDRDIYGETLVFDLVARLRTEMRFDGVDALVAQIRRDVNQGRELLSQQDQDTRGAK